jgi:uncharacterized phage-associated protein
MFIRFDFDASKAAKAMAYLVSRLEGQKTDKVKLMKLLYLADRDHFLEEGRPITGDDQYAMPYGPAPTLSLDLLEEGADGGVFAYLHTQDNEVSLKQPQPPVILDPSECRVLDAVIARYGAMPKWDLVNYTHKLPEYVEMNRPGTSTRIPFELLLKLYRNGNLFRHGRPVITSAMARNMRCPFPNSDSDL